MCEGNPVETQSCTTFATCEARVDGQWSEWGQWSDCVGPCGATGKRTRARACDSPAPAHGGQDCAGESQDTASCETNDCGACECTDWLPAGSCSDSPDGMLQWTRTCAPVTPQVRYIT
jgi:hypothetical protein